MATFRVEKNKGYTVMSNYHLRDKNLSLKAKGLLSYMLSLPEDWDYTLSGLSVNCKDKIDSVRSGIKELEDNRYLKRTRKHDVDGRFGGNEYNVYEVPYVEADETQNEPEVIEQMNHDGNESLNAHTKDGSNCKMNNDDNTLNNGTSQPLFENPMMDENTSLLPSLEKPILVNPTLEKPSLENPMQLNTDILNTNIQKDKIDKIDSRARKLIKQQIEYDALYVTCNLLQKGNLDELVEVIVEVAMAKDDGYTRINGVNVPIQLVKERFNKLTYGHIEYVLDCFTQNVSEIKNIKKYMLTALFNAPATIDTYYTNQVSHDLFTGS